MSTLRESLAALLSQGLTAVYVVPTPGLVLPPQLRDRTVVQLNLSYRFGSEYPVVLEDDGVRATLSFSGERFTCWLPYAAIKRASLLDGKGRPLADGTREAPHADNAGQRAAAAEPEPGQVLRTRGHFRLLKGGAS